MKIFTLQKPTPEIEPPPAPAPRIIPPEIIPDQEENDPWHHPTPEIAPQEPIPEIKPDEERK